jgi:hypothetical protein
VNCAIGNEGIVNIPLFMGGDTTPNQAVVQHPGCAYLLDEQVLKEEVQPRQEFPESVPGSAGVRVL